MTEDLRLTPLHKAHEEAGARLVDFAGWHMPVQYAGINAEHAAVRERAGRFDVSHMGRVRVAGPGALAWLDAVLPAKMDKLRLGQMSYTVLCTPEGGAVDDLAVYRTGDDEFLLVVNASRTSADLSYLGSLLPADDSVRLADETALQAMIAIQGPAALDCLREQPQVERQFDDLASLGFFRFRQGASSDMIISRSGYTGEDGFEVICSAADGVALWNGLGDVGVAPIGLGARDTLRTEMGYPLYGHELSTRIGPVEAGLEWALRLDQGGDFVGREALEKRRRTTQRLAGLKIDGKGIPRPDCEVHQSGVQVGAVTSGTYSPTLQAGIALALIDEEKVDRQASAAIVVRGRDLPASFCDLPFVPSRVKRRRPRRSRAS